MQLSSLLPALQRHAAFAEVVNGLERERARSRVSVITSARPYALAALHAALRVPMLVVTARTIDARGLAAELNAWVERDADVSLFPETDALPYDYLPNDPVKLADRLAVLQRLAGLADDHAPPLVVSSARSATDLLEDPRAYRERHQRIARGQAVSLNQLVQTWLMIGYEPSPLVDQPGLFSRRGGILDVFPPGGRPLRIEFWGDEIDTIRVFDPATQRSTDQLDQALVGPAHEVLPRPVTAPLEIDRVRAQLRGTFERDRRFLVEGQQAFGALEFYRGFLGTATLSDYLPADGVLVLVEPTAVAGVAREFEEQVEQLHTDLLDRGEVPIGLERPYREWRDVVRHLDPTGRQLDVVLDPDVPGLPFVHAPRFGGRLDAFMDALDRPRGHNRAVVVSQQSDRLAELLRERGLEVEAGTTAKPELGPITFVHGLSQEGWVAAELNLALYTDSEIFGWTKQRRAATPRRSATQLGSQEARDRFIADLEPGQLVVHVDHGIARYGGLVRSEIGFTPESDVRPNRSIGQAEFLVLQYAEGDHLYVPGLPGRPGWTLHRRGGRGAVAHAPRERASGCAPRRRCGARCATWRRS